MRDRELRDSWFGALPLRHGAMLRRLFDAAIEAVEREAAALPNDAGDAELERLCDELDELRRARSFVRLPGDRCP